MPPSKVIKDVVLEVGSFGYRLSLLLYLIESPDDQVRALSKKVLYVTICDASIIRRDERSTESSLILKES